MSKKLKVKTNIKTLKKAWAILKKLQLEALLSGGDVKVNIGEIIDELLVENQLCEFCQVITDSDTDFEELELSEVAELLGDFFTAITQSFQKLKIAGMTASVATPLNPPKIPSGA